MLHVVFPKHLYLTAKFIVGTSNGLVFTLVSMAIKELSLDLVTTFVLTVYYFVQTALVVLLKVLEDYHCRALLVTTVHLPKSTLSLMTIHLSTLELDLATHLKKTVSFVRAFNDFIRAVLANVIFKLSSFDLAPAFVSAL